jgi:hypothetical protein
MKENVEAISCFDKIQFLVVEGLIKSLLTPLDILYAKVNKSKKIYSSNTSFMWATLMVDMFVN